MSKESTLILLGILLILTPFLGLPSVFRVTLFCVFGLAVVLIGISLKSRMRRMKKSDEVAPTYDQEILGGE